MSESDLNTYKLQLQQVEAALTTDPDNEVCELDDLISIFIMLNAGAKSVKNRP